MYNRVENALKTANCPQYFSTFQENEMDDKMVDRCLQDPSLSSELSHMIPIRAHLIKFKLEFNYNDASQSTSQVDAMTPRGGRMSLKRGRLAKRAPSVPSELEEVFNALDVDHSGRISVDELFKATKNDSRMSLDTCRLMISLFDDQTDPKGSIDLTGFVSLSMKIDDWNCIFESFDKDGSGYLEPNEVMAPLENMARGYKFDDKFVSMIIKKFGDKTNGGMDSNGFISAAAFVSSFTRGFRDKDKNQQGFINYQDFLDVVLNAWN